MLMSRWRAAVARYLARHVADRFPPRPWPLPPGAPRWALAPAGIPSASRSPHVAPWNGGGPAMRSRDNATAERRAVATRKRKVPITLPADLGVVPNGHGPSAPSAPSATASERPPTDVPLDELLADFPAPTAELPVSETAEALPAEVVADAIEDDHVETWQLVTLAQAGDGDAFGLLYDKYVEPVYRYLYYRVGDRGLAEDFTSETFLRALRRIGKLEYQGRDVGAWFITIARNLVLDHAKSARNRFEVVTDEPIEGSNAVASTESTVLANLTSQELVAAVNQLGADQRECIVLRFIQGLSVSETAAVMGKGDGAVKALQHRAIRRLMLLLGESK
jgi:RNA polymerase sigma-70 factor (TIGR02952 family)